MPSTAQTNSDRAVGSRADIETLLEPVMMVPLRREWAAVKHQADAQWEKVLAAAKKQKAGAKPSKARQQFERLYLDFMERLAHVTVLDPACGSGNFLYVALHLLLNLEKEVITQAARAGVPALPHVRPTQLAGIEINPYAQQLAQVVIWIGYLQWMRDNGFSPPSNPVLEPIESIRNMDAILDLANPTAPLEPEWPEAEFIVGNPPFLGGKMLRTNLGDEYVDTVFKVWKDRVRAEADLCCYWFEKARDQIERNRCKRAGLLSTQGIRGGANRETLKRIKESGNIFFAESDRDWCLDGATVHVSMVGFDDGTEDHRVLNSETVPEIHANLSAAVDITQAKRIDANCGIGFMGDTKGGAFDISFEQALELLTAPNPNGRPSSDVVTPWVNGLDVTRRPRNIWIIDFGTEIPERDAAAYEGPFEYLRQNVYESRKGNKRESYRDRWWIHAEARSGMRRAFEGLSRFLMTTTVAKHRLFVWCEEPTLPDHQLIAFARADDFFLGVLHSRVHEVWARSQGTQVRERESGFRYTPTSCFETFAMPTAEGERHAMVEVAARELASLWSNWLNPPELIETQTLEFPGSVDGPWRRFVVDADAQGIGTVRYPRLIPRNEAAAETLKKRTLTNLYNQRPTWLDLAHKKLDEAVFAAYGWDPGLSDDELLAKLLELNLEQAGDERWSLDYRLR